MSNLHVVAGKGDQGHLTCAGVEPGARIVLSRSILRQVLIHTKVCSLQCPPKPAEPPEARPGGLPSQ